MLKFSLAFALLLSGVVLSSAQRLPSFLERFDTNADGIIDEEERQAVRDLRDGLRQEGHASLDTDGNGRISAEEEIQAQQTVQSRLLARREAKFLFIAGEDNLISYREFYTIPNVDRLPNFVAKDIWDRLDLDADGFVSQDEFLARLRRRN